MYWYPASVMTLQDAITESAQSVTRDPRFPPLSETELDAIIGRNHRPYRTGTY